MRKQLMMALLLVAGAFSISKSMLLKADAPAILLEVTEGFPYELEQKLIELHAAPNWQLSRETAWLEYKAGIIRIREVEQGKQYVLSRGTGVLEVVVALD